MPRVALSLRLTLLLAATAAGRALAQAPDPPASNATPALQRVLGEVSGVDAGARTLVVKSEDGRAVSVIAHEKASFLRALPGARDLQGATPIGLAEIAAGDRVLARGTLSPDGASLNARQVVVMTRADLTQKQDSDRADWTRRGIAGVVTAVDPGKKEIMVETRSLSGVQAVVLDTGTKNAAFRRYAPDSVKFSEARPSTFADLQVGDQVRAVGDRTPDGARLLAEQVVSGSFQTLSGAVKSVGADQREIVLVDNDTQKPLTVHVGSETMVRRLPPQMAMRLAARNRGEGGGPRPEAGPRPEGAPDREPRGPGGAGRRMGGGSLQEMLERLPSLSLTELKPGDQIAVSSTRGQDPSRVSAVVVLAGIEPLLESRPRGGPGQDASPGLPPGALDLGFGAQ
jgi:hypothetical protein